MPYALVDIDLERPLPPLQLAPDETGIGVLARKGMRPAGFFLAPLPAGAEIEPAALGDLIAAHLGPELLRRHIEDELLRGEATPSPIDLTVAICTRDRPELLRTCLTSLLRLRVQGPRRFEVLVIDNASSTRDTFDVAASMDDVRYILEPRPGLDFARNRALREVRTEMIAFIDDDAVLDRGWLSGLEAAWAHDPQAVAITGQVLPLELATDAQVIFEESGGFRRGFQTVRFAGQTRDRSPRYPILPGMFGTGCNMAFRVDGLRRLGGFDEALDTGPALPGGGDLDIFYRVIRAGYSLVYEPGALVFHRHRRELKALRHQYWTWGTSLMAFVHKTYRQDPEMRPRVRRAAVTWLWGNLAQTARSFSGNEVVTPELALAQLAGGLLTFPWMYPLSRWRVARIARQHAAP
ncbi:MAG: glycosyltransferase [Actinomycetota bacterium]|nr:glycosyltransferase [Actinomycetota bacterium]